LASCHIKKQKKFDRFDNNQKSSWVTSVITLIKVISFIKLWLKMKYLLLVKGFSTSFINIKKSSFLLKPSFLIFTQKLPEKLPLKP
jgi:hypothetical protein